MQTAARQSPEIEYARAKIFVAEKAVSDAEAEAAGGWAAMAFDAALSAWAKSEEAERAAFGLPFAIRETAAKVSVAAKDVLMRAAGMVVVVQGSLPDDEDIEIPAFVLATDWSALKSEGAALRRFRDRQDGGHLIKELLG